MGNLAASVSVVFQLGDLHGFLLVGQLVSLGFAAGESVSQPRHPRSHARALAAAGHRLRSFLHAQSYALFLFPRRRNLLSLQLPSSNRRRFERRSPSRILADDSR